jgi:hypothetical protein
MEATSDRYPIPIAIAMWLTNIPRSRRAAVQGLAAVALTMDPLSYEGVESRRNYPPAAARAEDSWRRDEPRGWVPEQRAKLIVSRPKAG